MKFNPNSVIMMLKQKFNTHTKLQKWCVLMDYLKAVIQWSGSANIELVWILSGSYYMVGFLSQKAFHLYWFSFIAVSWRLFIGDLNLFE